VTADRNFCTDYCDASNPCPTGFSCTPAGDQSVCVPDSGGLGQACMENPDCVSGICASEGGESYCSRYCSDAEPCPTGFECLPAGGDVNACARIDAPPPMDGGCGCRVEGGSRAVVAPALGLILAVLLGWRRRR
jgi:MYXO-CTERM domain-containing protein